jgi:hypothetical protein
VPITFSNLKTLIKILGPHGAAAGLKASDISLDEARSLAQGLAIKLENLDERDGIIDAIISESGRVGIKPIEELLKMSFEEISSYFDSARVSNTELLELMKQMNYKVSSEDKKSLKRFAARQISETARFAKVANRSS